MDIETSVPFYLNWTFWTVFVSAVAVLLSQIPPIHVLIKKARIDVEPYAQIYLSHWVGNPNAQLHIIVNNIGGKRIRVRRIEASIFQKGKLIVKLPARNFFKEPTDNQSVLFTGFSLDTNIEWAHTVNFVNFFGRDDERNYRSMEESLRSNIYAKLPRDRKETDPPVEADAEIVDSLNIFFAKHFIWKSGEYDFVIKITTNIEGANVEKRYRFTIFEYHENELIRLTDGYK